LYNALFVRAFRAIFLVTSTVVLWTAAAAAQPARLAAGSIGSAPRPSAAAAAVDAAPVLDGEVLGDPAWQTVPAIADFSRMFDVLGR